MNKALIVAPSWIGDTIMAQPLFARLCARHPGLQLDALAPRWVAPVLQRMAEIHEVIDSPFGHGQLSIKARWRLGRDLAARGYDAVYVLPNSLKSALVPWLAGIPQRVGFTGESRYGLINVRHDLDKQALPLMVERFVQLAETPGTPPPKPIAYPRIRSSQADQQRTLAELSLSKPQRIVAFCPGAEYGPAKRWPAAHFATLARQLAAHGCAIWLFGSPKDHAVGVNATVAKVASGAAETVPYFMVTNLARTLGELKERNIWIIGTSGDAPRTLYQADLKGPVALVLGAEGAGMRQLTRKTCDELVSIPMQGAVESLNVSVASGVCLYEALRQRGA